MTTRTPLLLMAQGLHGDKVNDDYKDGISDCKTCSLKYGKLSYYIYT